MSSRQQMDRQEPVQEVADATGTMLVTCCENCNHLYDDSDGYEYGPPSMRCRKKPHMENLKGFPFKTPQHCFELHWAHFVDWEAEAKKNGQSTEQSVACPTDKEK